MANKYVSTSGNNFQYLIDDGKPFYTALVTNQGYTASATALTETRVGHPNEGNVKLIFPGSNITADDSLY